MSAWRQELLQTKDGDLLSIQITVEAYLLEDLLETLAESPYPVNPEIEHHYQLKREGRTVPAVRVEFPAWRSWVPEIRERLKAGGFGDEFETVSMLEEIRA